MRHLSLSALVLLASAPAFASDQSENTQGFVDGSHLNVLLRNAYMNRDYKHGAQDRAEWGQGVIGNFTSGFTQGTVGVGVDAFGLYALRLDGGSGRSGAAGIGFFKQDSSGNAADDLMRAGANVKLRFSNTVIRYGDMMPSLPVLNYDDSRLLPESFTGTMITSNEIDGLELTAARFHAEARKDAEQRDGGELKSIEVFGGRYTFSPELTASFYASDVEDRLKKQYLGATYVMPVDDKQSVTLDFNGYRTRLDRDYANGNGRDNKIWSLAATYTFGAHSITLAHQRSSGDTGYQYGWYQGAGAIGDGGSTVFLANSYWSDFNAEDEHSWQLGYGLDFTEYGVPGLSYRIAYVRGDNIHTNDGEGVEREIFNQVQYVVQNGAAKDLKLRLRSSWVRTSNNTRTIDYMDDGNEIRAFVEYPISFF
ncbi:OprD family porin [Pseudomonas matsuisoli]|uniref:Porin n=1 Tax=Pseudomonas matsuisoli TaxID=1515666 RepID=A0A917UYA8_9PSED|nr:OprD family porin [Pseudomonas matsuisoli]GGJ98118.1 porin [Pseudomonas matsuisoli]